MDTEITVENFPLLGLCNLCLNEGVVRSMLMTYAHEGKNELYSEMLLKSFSIDILSLPLGDVKRLICESCIIRLRDCTLFRKQVENSFRTLEATAKLSDVKKEDYVDGDMKTDLPDGFADDDDDDTALIDILIKKEEPTENRPKKRRKNRPTKKNSSKRIIKISLGETSNNAKDKQDPTPDLEETTEMLQKGLFPFKIRKNKMFTCSVCLEKSTNLDYIKSHISGHSKKNLSIALKKMIFSKTHRFYKVSTKLRCKICTTDVLNYEELKMHVENCTRLKYSRNWNTLPFKLEKDQLDCPVCNKRFLNFVTLNTHMNEHYPNHICDSCGKAFASKARLRGHMRTHEIGEFACKYCDAVFDRVTKRENHVSKEHKAGIRYACKRCNISLTSFYARQKHLAEVHNEELKKYKCQACSQSYITPGHLSSHIRRDHLNERNHKCDKCDLAFYTKNALKMHMIKHDGERIYKCTVCQNSYQRKKTLREHMRIHSNDKRFVCTTCGRAFTQKCTLKGHLKVHERKLDIDDTIGQPLHSI